jgi:hypothetical protein
MGVRKGPARLHENRKLAFDGRAGGRVVEEPVRQRHTFEHVDDVCALTSSADSAPDQIEWGCSIGLFRVKRTVPISFRLSCQAMSLG